MGVKYGGQSRSLHVNNISRLQNRAMRIINLEKFDGKSDPLYKRNKMLKLEDLLKIQKCIFVHDYQNNTGINSITQQAIYAWNKTTEVSQNDLK